MATRDYLNPSNGFTVSADIDYRETPTATHKLDLFKCNTGLPPGEEERFPTIIYAHGGSFVYGSRKDGGPVKFCSEMAKRGYNAASVGYPLIAAGAYVPITAESNATACMHDAIRWCWQNEVPHNIDTSRIVVAGDSAGACMAVMSAIAAMEVNNGYAAHMGKRPAAVLDFWGPTQIFGLPLGGPPFVANIAAGKLDKCIIVHGAMDTAVTPEHSYALRWVAQTYRVQADVRIQLLKGAGHTPWFVLQSASGDPIEGFYEDAFESFVVPTLKTMLAL